MPSVGPSPYPEQMRPALKWAPDKWSSEIWNPGTLNDDWTQPLLSKPGSKLQSKPGPKAGAKPDNMTTKPRHLEAILWWELRRIWFNLVLLAAGLVSLVLIFLVLSWIPSATDGVQSVFAIFMYVVSANVIYTLGWISELLWSGGDTTRTADVRPRVFRMGLMFSAGITLLPAVLAPAIWVLWSYR